MSPTSQPPTVYRVYCFDGSTMALSGGSEAQAASSRRRAAGAMARRMENLID